MSGRVTVQDHGGAALLKRVRELSGGRKVRVGILADKPKDAAPVKGSTSKKARVRAKVAATKSLLEIAIIHEFGGGHVPARSFIRATMDERAADIQRLQVAVARQVLSGALTAEQGLSQIGAKVAAWVQARIVAGIAPALAESTRRQKRRLGGKGKDTPLILTGQLKSSVTFAVVS